MKKSNKFKSRKTYFRMPSNVEVLFKTNQLPDADKL